MSPASTQGPSRRPQTVIDFSGHEDRPAGNRLPPVGGLRGEGPPLLDFAAPRRGRGGRRRPVRPERGEPRAAARTLSRGPFRRRQGEPAAADRRRPGRRPRGAPEGTSLHLVPAGPRLRPVLLPQRGGRGCRGRRDGGGAPRRRDRRRLRPRPGRGHEPGQPRDRGPGVLRRRGNRRAAGRRLPFRMPLRGDPPGRETFPGARRHLRRLPRGTARGADARADPPLPGAAAVPPRRPRGDPGADDRPRGLPGAGPGGAGDALGEDPAGSPPRADAVPRRALLRRAGDAGDRGSLGGRGGGRARRVGRMRRGPGVPGGCGAGGGGLPAVPRGPGQRYVPSDSGDGGEAYGTASGVGGVERTLSAGPPVGGVEAAPCAGGPSVGALGKYRENITGR